MINRSYLILGGNMGNRAASIETAEKKLSESGVKIVAGSKVYETAPWHMESCESFLNKVIKVETNYSAEELMRLCLHTEEEMGRLRKSGAYESRIIDIDILFFNDEITETDQLHIPHPRLHLRRFVLVPLSEIDPQLLHPVLKKTARQLLLECADEGEVHLYLPA